jgi:hypothetical protein
MGNALERMSEVLSVVKNLGLQDVSPIILSDAANFVVHLAPYPIVARVAKQLPGHRSQSWREVLARELRVARHLSNRGIPVVSYSTTVPAGPHQVGDSWMTLWEYIAPASLPRLEPERAVDMVNELTTAFADFHEPLPYLGVWGNVVEAANLLRTSVHGDDRISSLLQSVEQVHEKMQSLDAVFPCHGDAHPGNLLASADGWRWNDFEDVSFMPRFWDLASLIGNTALFHRLRHPVVDYVLKLDTVMDDMSSFQFALTARAVMATTTNLALAIGGNGDLDFAKRQLDCICEFLAEVDKSFK